MKAPVQRLERFARSAPLYSKFRNFLPVITFLAGFVWDSLTLTRIDRLSDNLILLGYLLLLAIMIVISLRLREGVLRIPWLLRLEPHMQWAMQFLFGGLLSSYVVFYFRSTSFNRAILFLSLLFLLLVANEFLENRLGNPRLMAGMFFFCSFSFLAFFLPILFSRLGTLIFLAAGAGSLLWTLWLFALAFPLQPLRWIPVIRPVAPVIVLVYAVLHLFYFLNLIPPVPLSLKSAGIYHSVVRTPEGYRVEYVRPAFYRFWKHGDDPFYHSPGEAAYCYTSIFAPGGIRVPILHRWSRYQPGKGWEPSDRIRFEIFGGREGGYRGYSMKRTLAPGRWRVEVETETGSILGHLDFDLVPVTGSHPPLVTEILR